MTDNQAGHLAPFDRLAEKHKAATDEAIASHPFGFSATLERVIRRGECVHIWQLVSGKTFRCTACGHRQEQNLISQ